VKLIKTSKNTKPPAEASQEGRLGKAINRRTFMRRTGLTLGGGAIATGLAPKMVRRARAEKAAADAGEAVTKRTICTHCSAGCGTLAEIRNGVWTRQQPDFD